MLSVVKREDLTQEILIGNNEISGLRTIVLPIGWWHTTISYDLEKPKKTLKLIQPKRIRHNAPSFPKIDYWDLRKGDYKVKDYYKKPMRTNSEYKKVIVFAHFSFTIVVTIVTVFILLQIAQV